MPICAPNAVCSKIDLYDTPWIERQCRCPTYENQHKNDLYLSPNDVRHFIDDNQEVDEDPINKYKIIHLLTKNIEKERNETLTKSSRFFYTHFRHHGNNFPKINGCSRQIGLEDGHTIHDKTREYKLCDRVNKLPTCR